MKIKYPNYSHKFSPSEDEIYLDYDIDYDNDSRFVWDRLPILKSTWYVDSSKDDVTLS